MDPAREEAEDRLDNIGYITRHQRRVREMMDKDDKFREAYLKYLAEDVDNWTDLRD